METFKVNGYIPYFDKPSIEENFYEIEIESGKNSYSIRPMGDGSLKITKNIMGESITITASVSNQIFLK